MAPFKRKDEKKKKKYTPNNGQITFPAVLLK